MNRAERRQTARAHGWKGTKANAPKAGESARVSIREALERAQAIEDAQERQRAEEERQKLMLSAVHLAQMGFVLPGADTGL